MAEFFSIFSASFILVFLAEFGDKSQLVCMTLAAKHRPWPVLLGATIAFSLLNALAVLFGSVVASWIPATWLAILVACLFGFFGVQALLTNEDDTSIKATNTNSHSLFLTAFLMIFVAEFGDKTQLAVAGLASTNPGPAVWAGATLALTLTSFIGVIAGQTLLKKIPTVTIHRLSGTLFLLFAAWALFQAFQ